jgi:hypothetical protein
VYEHLFKRLFPRYVTRWSIASHVCMQAEALTEWIWNSIEDRLGTHLLDEFEDQATAALRAQ